MSIRTPREGRRRARWSWSGPICSDVPVTSSCQALRRALATLAVALLAAVPVLLVPGPATAAHAAPNDCGRVGLAKSARAADAVFTGTVVEVSRSGGNGPGAALFTHDIEVERIYKGRGTDGAVQVVTRSASPDRTGLGALEPEETYLFFVNAGDGVVTADGCGGTRLLDEDVTTRVEAVLGSGRPAVPPEPPEAAFTRVSGSEPAEFTRAAAPGAALVLVGLLGLVLVGRLGRRG